jgi:hypothetical protein
MNILKALTVAAALSLTALCSFPSIGYAADSEEAVQHYERGLKLYESQAYDAALHEFEIAYKLSGNYRLLFNIGLVATEVKDYVAATDAFNRYLAAGGSEVPEAKRTDVRERLGRLAMLVGSLRIVCNVDGAEIAVDDRMVGTSPLSEAIQLTVGRRRVTATYRGKSVSSLVQVTSTEKPTATLTFTQDAVIPPPPVAKEPVTPPSFPLVPWIITGALGAGAAVTGILAVSARNDLSRNQGTFGVTQDALNKSKSKAQTLGYVTDGLLIGTVIGAGISTYLTIRYSANKKTVSGAVTPTGLFVQGSF